MEWRIVKSGDGRRYRAEYGGYVESCETSFGVGCYMGGFNVSKSAYFDTLARAERYIREQTKKRR